MVVGICTLELSIPAAASLKDKRQVVKSLIGRLRNEFNVSVAEVDRHDSWQSAVIAAAAVSTSQDYTHTQLMRLVQWVEQNRLDCYLEHFEIEFL